MEYRNPYRKGTKQNPYKKSEPKPKKRKEKLTEYKTEWIGLWRCENKGYISQSINISKLREHKGSIRVYLIHNKFYEKDSNRPKYVISIMDGDTAEKEIENVYFKDEERLYTREEVQRCINGAIEDAKNGWTDLVPEDYV